MFPSSSLSDAPVAQPQHSQGFPLLSQTSKLRLLEASQMWMPEVPTVRVAKNCDRLPGPGLTASRPSKLRSLSLASRSEGGAQENSANIFSQARSCV